MSVLASVYSLAKNNNGVFKSEKQKAFLIAQLLERDGAFVEKFTFGEFGGASAMRSVIVSWDDSGITEIKTIADRSGKECVKFKRQSENDYAATLAEKAVKNSNILLKN